MGHRTVARGCDAGWRRSGPPSFFEEGKPQGCQQAAFSNRPITESRPRSTPRWGRRCHHSPPPRPLPLARRAGPISHEAHSANSCVQPNRLPVGFKECSNLSRIDGTIPRDLLDGEAQLGERVKRRALDWPANPLRECLLQHAIQLVSIVQHD